MRNKFIIIVSALALSSCGRFGLPGGPSSFDTISYQVIGGPGVGNGIITYTTPTGIVQLPAVNLNQPWVSGPIAGYGEFHGQDATLTVLAFGCIRGQVLRNAAVTAEQTGCGQPITLTVR